MTTLYELTDQYQVALNELVGSDFDEETIADTLEGLRGTIEEKGKNVAAFFQNLEADATAMKEAEARIARRRKAIERTVERLKDYLRDNMDKAGISKIECAEFSVSLGKASKVVEITDEKLIPATYAPPVTIKMPNKKLILAALKSDKSVPGTKLGYGKKRLTIK